MSSEALSLSRSAEHLLDAQEIQSLLEKGLVTRPSVKAHLEALAKKIHRDASALKRMEDSQKKLEENKQKASKEDQDRSDDNDGGDGSKPQVEEIPSPAQTPAVSPAVAVAVPASTSPAAASADNLKYKPIHKFAFDSGSYNSPTVTIYISIPNIGSIPDPSSQITCKFTSTSFDLTIHDFEEKKANANENESGKNKNVVNYRLVKNNLANEINPDKSKYILKANKIVIKLAKTKTEYGSYDSWNELTSSKSAKKGSGLSSSSKKDPTAGIMDLMKDMYDKGDDKMKKMIGETMLKQREGRLDGPGGVGGGMDGMDGMDDLGM